MEFNNFKEFKELINSIEDCDDFKMKLMWDRNIWSIDSLGIDRDRKEVIIDYYEL